MNAEFAASLIRKEFSGTCVRGGSEPDQATLSALSRARRWARKSMSRALFLPLESEVRKGYQRFLNCHRLRRKDPGKLQWGRELVDLRKSKISQALYYANLQTCGSPWACPLCASKITERRREELQAAVDAWLALGNEVALLSLTNSHHAGELLRDLMDGQARAWRMFGKDHRVRDMLSAAGVVGYVRAWEVTHGRLAYGHGWHPHFHVLLFIDLASARARFRMDPEDQFAKDFFAKLLQGPLGRPWQEACERAGLGAPSAERGVRVDWDQGGGSAVYVAKMGLEEPQARRWTFADEVTRGQTKKAADGKGETPFELLDSILEDPEDRQAGRLFIEYADATKGRSQVHWSRELRKRLDLGESQSDEEVASEVREDDPLWAHLSLDQWRLVVRAGAEWQVLRTGETEGLDGVLALLQRLEVNHVEGTGSGSEG